MWTPTNPKIRKGLLKLNDETWKEGIDAKNFLFWLSIVTLVLATERRQLTLNELLNILHRSFINSWSTTPDDGECMGSFITNTMWGLIPTLQVAENMGLIFSFIDPEAPREELFDIPDDKAFRLAGFFYKLNSTIVVEDDVLYKSIMLEIVREEAADV